MQMALFSRKHKIRSDSLSKSSVIASVDTDVVIRPHEDEQTYLKEAGSYFDISSREELNGMRRKIRRYSVYNDTLSVCIMLTAMFVTSGAKIVCEDAQNEAKLNALFKRNQMQDFLYEFVKEYLISGEATSFATWDDEAKCFTDEQILNPEQIEIKPSLFKNEDQIVIGIPEQMQSVFNDQYNEEHDEAIHEFKDIYDTMNSGRGLRVDDSKILRMVNRAAPWDLYGVPVFAPAIPALVQEESLDAALYEQLSTLITPTIIGTVGLKAGELGPDVGPWVPTQGELDQIKESYRTMMMARFRLGLFTIGVHFENAFSSSQVPSLDRDYARCDQKILRCIAAGKGLLDGSSGGPFASNAINRDVYGSVIKFIRDKVKACFQKRIDTAIREMTILAYRSDENGRRTRVEAENGELVYETAFLDFDNGVMKNANDALETALKLANAEVPISKQTLADIAESGIQVNEEIRRLKNENDTAQSIGLEKDPLLSIKTERQPQEEEVKSPLDSRNF